MQAKLQERPRLITWVARTEDIHASVRQCNIDIGPVQPMSRGQLSWQITISQDGALPLGGLVPALIEWGAAQHPSNRLPDSNCRLVALEGYHNKPSIIQEALTSLALEKEMVIKAVNNTTEVILNAQVGTPTGIVVLD